MTRKPRLSVGPEEVAKVGEKLLQVMLQQEELCAKASALAKLLEQTQQELGQLQAVFADATS